MSSLWLNLQFTDIDSRKQGCTKLIIQSWQSKLVIDVKYVIEERISAPVCDQRLFYGENALTDDSLSLKCLYLRDGDTIHVEYLATADIEGMKRRIEDLKEFAQTIRHKDTKNLFEVTKFKDFSYFPNYDNVVMSMEVLAFEYFIPWKKATTISQRHYFVQEGSFDDFMEVFKFSKLRFRAVTEETSQDKEESLDGKGDISDIEAQIDYYNNEQMVLQMHCLSLLWNFSETSESRQLVLRHGGLQLVCDALLLDPNESDTDNDTFWAILSINETAVGSLVQYAEFPNTQQILANNSQIINKLIYMVECRLRRETSFYPLYSSQISANTLFCCACDISTPKAFVENGIHIRMINLTAKLLNQDHDMALRYYCCLFLARILSCPMLRLEQEISTQINGLLSLFMREHTPKDISSWEEKHNYVWVTLVPFVSLGFAGGAGSNSEDSDCDQNEAIWMNDRWPGTPQTQEIGVFCIQHMLSLKENCELIVKQNLLPYLTCLKWQVKEPLKNSLKDAMQKLPESYCPPPLAVIARSQLACAKGFEVALHM